MAASVMATTDQLMSVCRRVGNIAHLLETDPRFCQYQQWARILEDEAFETHSGRHFISTIYDIFLK